MLSQPSRVQDPFLNALSDPLRFGNAERILDDGPNQLPQFRHGRQCAPSNQCLELRLDLVRDPGRDLNVSPAAELDANLDHELFDYRVANVESKLRARAAVFGQRAIVQQCQACR